MNIRPNSENLLLRLLDASTERQAAISHNLANQNTPGFKRKLVVFEDLVAAALDAGARDLSGISHQVVDDLVTDARPDGNNVTPELEQVADQENRLRYETYITILQGEYSLLHTAITGGN